MIKIYGEADANPKALAGLKIAVIGYGSQGRGQALNLRDSGCNVTIGLRPNSRSWKQALEDGWKPLEPAAAVEGADIVVMLAPDMTQPKLYQEAIAPRLKPGALLLFSHGFNIHYGQIKPDANIDVSMVAPKGPGSLVRRQFEEGRGVPCLLAMHRDASGKAFERTLAYAHALGATRAAVLETTFAEETETDLFGEQAVLCGGVTELIVAGWETLVAAGYNPEVAYFECLHEMKLIVDLIHEGGISRMLQFVSETAKYGDLSRGTRVIDGHVREEMKKILAEVRSGEFAREWIAEDAAGRPRYNDLLQKDLEHPIEKIGAQLRSRMAWLQQKKTVSA
ncbi:MAG TPA: ketol-acid reductoisomerase [Patescibacteria group bacterium]|nr:ketol-acid reductoisomerase [Patescibacteria group bacterium]